MQMVNPFAKAMQRSLDAALEAMQEELGQMSQRLIQGILTPEILGSLMEIMQASLSASSLGFMGFDMGKFASTVGQQPGYNPYKILGLERSASDEEVKKRYRELVHILHPDKSGTPGTGLFFQMVTAAFEVIRRERGWL
jgi:DnaJ-domain-containing protein 1